VAYRSAVYLPHHHRSRHLSAMARLRQWTSWHGVVTNARRPFHAQTSLRKWALHQRCRCSLQVQLHLPVTAMFTGINSGSGPWYSRSRAGHNCQLLSASLPVSAYVTISSQLYGVSTCVRQSLCCHVTPLHCFYSLFLSLFQVYGSLPILSVITIPSLSSQSVT
jgi:hypothetical protein